MSNSLIKAYEILDLIARKQGHIQQINIAQELNLKKSTVHRYLETLEQLDLIYKHDRKYYLGLNFIKLGNLAKQHNALYKKFYPLLHNLSEKENETFNLAYYNKGKITYLIRTESNRKLQLRANVGSELPFNATSLGKAIISILPEDIMDNMLKSDFIKYTTKTITEKSRLKNEIVKIQNVGYSFEKEEFEEGLICAAIPIYLKELNFYGAISVSATTNRMNEKKIINIIKRIRPQIKDYLYHI